VEVGAEGSTLAGDYEPLNIKYDEEKQGDDDAVGGGGGGGGEDDVEYGQTVRDASLSQLSARKGGDGDARGNVGLDGMLEQVLGGGTTRAKTSAARMASRVERQVDDEYTELKRMQDRAEAAFNIICEEESF